MLRRIAWSSDLSWSFPSTRLNEIIAPSRRNNERHHISGMLLFTGAHFIGILEGDDRDLSTLWLRLERDQRHSSLVRIGDERCGERWFPEWLMGYGDHADVGPRIDSLRSTAAPSSRWSDVMRPMMMTANFV